MSNELAAGPGSSETSKSKTRKGGSKAKSDKSKAKPEKEVTGLAKFINTVI